MTCTRVLHENWPNIRLAGLNQHDLHYWMKSATTNVHELLSEENSKDLTKSPNRFDHKQARFNHKQTQLIFEWATWLQIMLWWSNFSWQRFSNLSRNHCYWPSSTRPFILQLSIQSQCGWWRRWWWWWLWWWWWCWKRSKRRFLLNTHKFLLLRQRPINHYPI